MRQIFFATKNKGKVNSIASVLSKFNIKVVQKPLEIPEIRSENLKDIAIYKVLYAFEKIKGPVIALDSGFYVHSIGGFPKMYVNFALKTIGVNGILKLVKNIDRSCEFRNCLVFFDGTLKKPVVFEESVKGILADRPRGKKQDYFWSDLFFVFVPEDKNKTLAEMAPEEYYKWREELYINSYLTKFAKWLSGR